MEVKQHLAERLMNFLIHGKSFRFSMKTDMDSQVAVFRELSEWLDANQADTIARLRAENETLKDQLNSELTTLTIECDSCGIEIETLDGMNHTCHGCKKVICQSCCDVFDHVGDGLHDTGDPAHAVARLRAELAEDKARLDRLQEWMAPSEYERVDLISNYLTDDDEPGYAVILGGDGAPGGRRDTKGFRGYFDTLREAIDAARAESEGD